MKAESMPQTDPGNTGTKRLKAVILGPTQPPSGGISTVLNDMLASSLAEKAQLVLVDSRKRTPVDRTLIQGIKAQARLFAEYIRTIRREKPDVVHIHSGGSRDFYRKAFDVLAARLLRKPVVLHNHSGDFNLFVDAMGPCRRAFVRFILNRCTRVIVLSQWWKEFHAKLTPPARLRVLHNAIHSAPYENNPPKQQARRTLDLPEDRVIFLMMGVKGHRKGAFDIVEAAPQVKAGDPKAMLLLVGPDEDIEPGAGENLARLAAEKGVEDTVVMRGEVDAAARYLYYAAADCLLLPSHAENAPMTIIEAMAALLPVVSTAIAAIPEMVDRDSTGILIEPGKPEQIAEAVLRLSRDESLRAAMGEAGYGKFTRSFEMEKAFVPKLLEIYQEAASAPSAPPAPSA